MEMERLWVIEGLFRRIVAMIGVGPGMFFF